MEITNHLKCSCGNCGRELHYLPSEAGGIIECPQCKESSRLPGKPIDLKIAPPRPLPPKPPKTCRFCFSDLDPETNSCPACAERRKARRTKNVLFACVAILALGVTAAVGRNIWQKRHAPPPPPSGPLLQPQVRTPKSINDLKPGKFYVEEKRGSGSKVAVGTVENASLNVHFNVKVELDVFDFQGNKIGTVSDVIREFSPNQTWQFIAALNQTNAATLKFVSIKEDQ